MQSRELRAFAARMRLREVTITEADLTNAVNGSPQSIVIRTPLPKLWLVSAATMITAYFTGGGATTCTLDIGYTGQLTSRMVGLNVLSTTALNRWLPGTLGASPEGQEYANVNILATFTPSAGQSLLNLTTGSLKIQLAYMVPDEGPDLP